MIWGKIRQGLNLSTIFTKKLFECNFVNLNPGTYGTELTCLLVMYSQILMYNVFVNTKKYLHKQAAASRSFFAILPQVKKYIEPLLQLGLCTVLQRGLTVLMTKPNLSFCYDRVYSHFSCQIFFPFELRLFSQNNKLDRCSNNLEILEQNFPWKVRLKCSKTVIVQYMLLPTSIVKCVIFTTRFSNVDMFSLQNFNHSICITY